MTADTPPFPLDAPAREALERLWDAGHAAYLVGGGVRDALLGRPSHDWDVATDARPERILALFPGAAYENRFGTVRASEVEITTFRREHRYADHRRPDAVTFTDELAEDLARRDFTVNAIAWGRGAAGGQGREAAGGHGRGAAGAGAGAPSVGFVDPFDGRGDLRAGVLRTVGEPRERFDEDALRLMRAARIASQLGLRIDEATRAAMSDQAPQVRWVSAERIGEEVRRMLHAPRPSVGLRILEETGILSLVLPEVSAQRGVPQAKVPGHDLLDHSLATLDGAARLDAANERLLLAALLHDIGKPSTMADGHFAGHERTGAVLARDLLGRLRIPSRDARAVERLIAEHMYHYEPDWSDAAVRRFVRRVGDDLVDDLLLLREADDEGSGVGPAGTLVGELRARVAAQRAAGAALTLAGLAVDGHDLQRELGLRPGPALGALLRELLELVTADPALNDRESLLGEARRLLDEAAARR